MKTKEELEEAIKDTITRYKEIIFGSDTSACMAWIDELRKQQAINQHVHDQKLMEGTTIDGDTMIDKRTGEAVDPEVDSTYCKDKF